VASDAGDTPRAAPTPTRRNPLSRPFALAALALALALSATASAEPGAADKATARSLMDRGDSLVASKDLAGALEAYRGAHAIMRVPTTGLEVAKTEAALGHLVEALDVALEVGRMPQQAGEAPVMAKARADAIALAQALEPRVPSLAITVRGAPDGEAPTVEVDGVRVPAAAAGLPRKVNPGKHVVKVTAPGRVPASRDVVATEGRATPVELSLEPAPNAPPTPASPTPTTPAPIAPVPATAPDEGGLSPLVMLGFGVGAIGIGVGAVTGAMSLSRASQAKSLCSGTKCPVEAGPDIDASKGLAWGSNIGFGVGVVGLAVGVYGLVTSRHAPPKPAHGLVVRPSIAPGWAGVGGAF
jgi:hypothetical protein